MTETSHIGNVEIRWEDPHKYLPKGEFHDLCLQPRVAHIQFPHRITSNHSETYVTNPLWGTWGRVPIRFVLWPVERQRRYLLKRVTHKLRSLTDIVCVYVHVTCSYATFLFIQDAYVVYNRSLGCDILTWGTEQIFGLEHYKTFARKYPDLNAPLPQPTHTTINNLRDLLDRVLEAPTQD